MLAGGSDAAILPSGIGGFIACKVRARFCVACLRCALALRAGALRHRVPIDLCPLTIPGQISRLFIMPGPVAAQRRA